MDKKDLQKHYNVLKGIHDEFINNELTHNNGKNIKIRDKAFKELEYLLQRFGNYVINDSELYEFLTSKDSSDYHRAIIWDEFNSFKYFGRDMARKLKEMSILLSDSE